MGTVRVVFALISPLVEGLSQAFPGRFCENFRFAEDFGEDELFACPANAMQSPSIVALFIACHINHRTVCSTITTLLRLQMRRRHSSALR